MAVYMGEFEKEIDVYRAFHAKVEDMEMVVASYDDEGYDGDAKVLLTRKYGRGRRVFYYASGSHCSCYGLEDQWNADEVSEEWLREQIKTHGVVEPAYDYHKTWLFWKEVDNWLISIE